MQNRKLTIEIGDWRVTMVPAPLGRYQRWWYHHGKAYRHDTCELMTEPELRAMLQKEMEERGDGDRKAGSDRPESRDQSDPEVNRCEV